MILVYSDQPDNRELVISIPETIHYRWRSLMLAAIRPRNTWGYWTQLPPLLKGCP